MKKQEMQSIILNYLKKESYTDTHSIRNVVKAQLTNQGIIGEKSESRGGVTRYWTETISDKDALLINEIIYDLLVSRIITPGIDAANTEFPWLHVSDTEKLKQMIIE